MNLRPLGSRVIVKQDEIQETTPSGLFLAAESREKPSQGSVLAVGDGVTLENGTRLPVLVAVGDHVIYGKFCGTKIDIEGQELLILNMDDLYAVLEQQ